MSLKKTASTILLCGLLTHHHSYATIQNTTIVYTQIKDCTEKIENENAAFSELLCQPIGKHTVEIKQQSPQYFIITLTAAELSAASELETYTLEAPMEPGKAIEWHLIDNKPKFMVFRVKTQTAKGNVNEMLTLNLVTDNRICALASIATKNVPNANEKVRDLIKTKFNEVKECPTSALTI